MHTRSHSHGTPSDTLCLILAAPGIVAWWVLLFALVAPAAISNWLFPIAFQAVNYTTPAMILAGLGALWGHRRSN